MERSTSASDYEFNTVSAVLEASNDLGRAYRLLRLSATAKRDTGYDTTLGPWARNAQLLPDSYRGLPALGSNG